MSADTIVGDVTVRRLRHEEMDALAHAIRDSTTLAQIENRWREQELGYREFMAAEVDGRIVGTVSVNLASEYPRAMHLFALDVGEGWRGHGIGTEIVRWVLDEARRRHCRRVYLEVRADNPARRLYHRMGFRRVGPAFVNAWWRFLEDGGRERVEELSYRMVRRV